MVKKVTSIVLTLCMMLSVLTVAPFTLQASAATSTTSSGLATNVQDGQILQCWNWSFNNIKSKMATIANQGFSAIQTSPIQCTKESTKEYYSNMKNSWWVYYQPVDMKIETNSYNALGTASEFKAMCTEAHKYGIKVIVDAVLNHTANNNGANSISTMVPSDLRNDSSCWHDISKNSWYESRWDITQFCMEGIPDLNTGNTKVQNYAINFLKECIDAGADGFRFDGAKHIEVPTDFSYASQFWPNVINATTSYAKSKRGITPFYYGEILDGPSGSSDKSNAQTALDSYMKYMSVTQSSVSNSIRNAVNGKNAQTAARADFYFDDGSQAKGTKSVLWNESHDTYVSGSSSGVSDTVMKKTWAVVGTRKEACGMYMARPSGVSSTMLGAADTTAWSSNEVKAVNWFKNNYIGQSEYLSNTEAIVCNERGTTGAILVNVSGTSTYASVNSHVLEAGTYNDAITGNTFTVANNKITGNIGSSGIAVLRKNATTSSTQPTTSPSSGSNTSTGKACTIYFDNSSYNWSSVYAYVYTDSGSQNAAWPGTKMTKDSSTGYYKLSVPASLGNGRVIFTQSSTTTTNRYPADGQTGMAIESTDKIFKANHSWTEYTGSTPTIYFDNSSYNWSSVYAYVYTDSGSQNAAWPGKKMTYDSSTGYYKLSISSSLKNGKVIFTESSSATTNRYPADQQPGLDINDKDMVFKANKMWSEYSPTSNVGIALCADAVVMSAGATARVTTSDASGTVTYSSANTSVATVTKNSNAQATVTAKSAGTTTVTAKDSIGNTDKITVNVGANGKITLGSTSLSLAVGKTAYITEDSSNTVTWTSSNTSVATVSRYSSTKGKVTGVKAGTATITAKDTTGATATCKVTVTSSGSITLGATSLSLEAGKYAYITEDSSNTVTWTSSNTSVATVTRYSSAKGKVTAVKAGTATITAKDTTGATATCKVTVTAGKITLGSTSLSLAAGKYAYITEDSSSTVTWTSSNTSVATVSRYSSTKGKVTGVKAGTATITATDTTGATATCKVTVTAGKITLGSTSLSLAVGKTAYITEDSSNTVTWTSSNTSVATVSRYSSTKGKVTAKKAGTATITATDTTGATATCKVTVTAGSITLGSTSLSLAAGKYAYITEDSSNTVTWTSSNTSVATVSRYSSAKGKVTGVKAGTATITATDTTGATATCKVTVTAGSITLGSTSLSLTVGNYAYITEDSSNTVTWTSSDTSVATVTRYSSAKGKVTGKKAGTATITATDTTGATATCKVTVKAASNTSDSTSGSSSSSSSSSSTGTSSGKTYTLVTSAPSDWSGDYVLIGKSGTTTYILDASGSYLSTNIGTTSAAKTLSDAGVTASGNTLTNVPDQYVYTIGKTASYYYLKMKNSTNYLTYKQNGLTTSTSNSGTTSQWSISLSSGVAKMTNRSASTYNLTFNSSSKMFRCYSSSNSYKLYLYKVS